MEKTLLMVLVSKRNENAPQIQQTLTEYGCIIKTRLGIHDGVLNECSNSGLIILELLGEDGKKQKLQTEIAKYEGVEAKLVNLSV